MSSFRQPPIPKLSSDTESSVSAEPQRPGANRSVLGENDDTPPLSSRFDKLPAGPVSQRPSSPPAPQNAPPRGPSAPTNPSTQSATRWSKGGIYQLTKILERKHGAFFISRLILASGISLRGYDSTSLDDPVTVTKFIKTLRNMLSPADMAEVLAHAPSVSQVK